MTKEVLKYLIQKLKDLFATKEEIPTKTSDLTNDNGYLTSIPSEYVTETELDNKGYLTEHQDISGKANISDLSTVATSGSYNDLTNKPTIPNKTSQLQNDSGYLTSIPNEYVTDEELNSKGYLTSIPSEYITETELNSKGYLTQHQDISGKVDKVDGKGLSTNDLTNNLKTQYDKAYSHSQSAHAPINAEANVQSDWNVTDVSSDAYILNKPTIPNKTSQLTNDSGYLTSIPSEYITESELNSKGYLTEHQDISGKVDKRNGKGLSTNDYTTEEKNKLSGIEENANNYSLPIASSTVLGGIKIGSGLSIDSNGVLSSSSGSSDLSNYQTKTDNALTTTNKTIVGAINELDIEGIKAEDFEDSSVIINDNLTSRVSALETNKADKTYVDEQISNVSIDLSDYQTKSDNTLTTTNKTIVGAINELDIEGIKAEDYDNDPVIVGNNLVARVSALETNESEVLSRVDSLESNKADVSRVSALETNKADKSSIPTSLPANGGNSNTVGGFSIWVGTQSEYDAITTKSSTTLYFIREV